MTIKIMYYTNDSTELKNVVAIDFDGETGELKVQGDNNKFITHKLVKEVQVFE